MYWFVSVKSSVSSWTSGKISRVYPKANTLKIMTKYMKSNSQVSSGRAMSHLETHGPRLGLEVLLLSLSNIQQNWRTWSPAKCIKCLCSHSLWREFPDAHLWSHPKPLSSVPSRGCSWPLWSPSTWARAPGLLPPPPGAVPWDSRAPAVLFSLLQSVQAAEEVQVGKGGLRGLGSPTC